MSRIKRGQPGSKPQLGSDSICAKWSLTPFRANGVWPQLRFWSWLTSF